MKNKLSQLLVLASRIDPRHIQLAYALFALLGLVFIQSPADGSGGGRSL
jgi:hypothetical protein